MIDTTLAGDLKADKRMARSGTYEKKQKVSLPPTCIKILPSNARTHSVIFWCYNKDNIFLSTACWLNTDLSYNLFETNNKLVVVSFYKNCFTDHSRFWDVLHELALIILLLSFGGNSQNIFDDFVQEKVN